MSDPLVLWAMIIAVAVLNYLSRLSFIALFVRWPMPPLVARGLRLVPAAMLAAIIVPAFIVREPATAESMHIYAKLIAAVLAGAIAWRTRSPAATMVGGMGALWLSQWLLRASS